MEAFFNRRGDGGKTQRERSTEFFSKTKTIADLLKRITLLIVHGPWVCIYPT